MDDTLPRGRGQIKRKDTLQAKSKNDTRRRDDDRGGRKERTRRDSDRYDDDRGRRGRSRRKDTLSEDEGYKTRRRGRSKRDSWSDNDSDYEDRRRRRKRRGKHRKPTNIDDFDENDYSDTDSYSSDYSDSSSSGSDSDDSRRRRKHRHRRSSSVSDLTGTSWALGGEDGGATDSISQRIKHQQAEIKKQLAALTQLQSETGRKALPDQHQTVLQKDLEKLEQLQAKLRYKQGDQNLQMQLLGQQMLLCEHLKEAQKMIMNRPGLGPNPYGQNLQMQMMQQQQQQRQLMLGQMQAEQQRQMMLAAEQQRQLQLGLLPGTPFVSPAQQSFGMGGGMASMYSSPYAGTVGYF